MIYSKFKSAVFMLLAIVLTSCGALQKSLDKSSAKWIEGKTFTPKKSTPVPIAQKTYITFTTSDSGIIKIADNSEPMSYTLVEGKLTVVGKSKTYAFTPNDSYLKESDGTEWILSVTKASDMEMRNW